MTTLIEIEILISALGRRLRQARHRRRWSQDTLARRMGVSRQTVDRMERGDHGMRIGTLAGALRAMDLPFDPVDALADPATDRVALSAELARKGRRDKQDPVDPQDIYDFGRSE